MGCSFIDAMRPLVNICWPSVAINVSDGDACVIVVQSPTSPHESDGNNIPLIAGVVGAVVVVLLIVVVVIVVVCLRRRKYLVIGINLFCRMTNYELVRWLVETLSRDVHHNRMMNESLAAAKVTLRSTKWCTVDHVLLQCWTVTWPCIISSKRKYSTVTFSRRQNLTIFWAFLYF